ncbi:nucleotidyltransferase family protein [Caulifigura coniformis]|nr:nucleotidyltransferase [Caulifigura coniformis]
MIMHTSPEHSHYDVSECMDFYRGVLTILSDQKVPFLVGGGYALFVLTGISRMTKDLDLFIRREDIPRTLKSLAEAGFETELAYSHWLAKARKGDDFVDLIFSSGNGHCPVDEGWFQNAVSATIGGLPIKLAPAEEMIWQKSFIMERERYDGADIAHLFHVRARTLDWNRLLRRFGSDWRVLLSHLILFGFIYPGEQRLVPVGVMQELIDRLKREVDSPPPADLECGGTLLSREQYAVDVNDWNYLDKRLVPRGEMTPLQVAEWTPPKGSA